MLQSVRQTVFRLSWTARGADGYQSANRDQTRFADPNRFDLIRTPNPHVAFGGGLELGISLAAQMFSCETTWQSGKDGQEQVLEIRLSVIRCRGCEPRTRRRRAECHAYHVAGSAIG